MKYERILNTLILIDRMANGNKKRMVLKEFASMKPFRQGFREIVRNLVRMREELAHHERKSLSPYNHLAATVLNKGKSNKKKVIKAIGLSSRFLHRALPLVIFFHTHNRLNGL